MAKRIGERIRELREEQDISLREFAKQLDNLSAAHLSDIELGRRYPSPELLRRIADKLNTPIDDLERLDFRPPLEELKRMADDNPTYGFALRKMLEKEVSPQTILDYLEKHHTKDKK